MDYQIVGIYDNMGKTFDRYTIVLNDKEGPLFNMCLCLSHNPDSPQGFSQFSSCRIGDHLGKKMDFNSLPKNIQNHIKSRTK